MLNMVDGQAGKGDSYRKVDPSKFRSNYDKIFNQKPAPKTNEHKGHKTRRKKS